MHVVFFFLLNLYATDPKAINTSAEITSIWSSISFHFSLKTISLPWERNAAFFLSSMYLLMWFWC